MSNWIFGIFLLLLIFFPFVGSAQKRLDLDDINIKGELHNDNRLVIIGRDRNELKNYVRFRTNYRKEMIEVLPTPVPGVK